MAGIDLTKYSSNNVQFEYETSIPLKREKAGGETSLLNREITLLKRKFGYKEKEAFYSELGLLLSTGVDIKTAFDILLEDIRDKNHKKIIEEIMQSVINGKRIYESMKMQEGVFSKYEIQSVMIGEETGKLNEVLRELGLYYKSLIKLKRQIVGVLTYPIVVISISILIVYFMLVFVVPVFSDIFSQTGHQLPEITLFLIRVSENTSSVFYVFAIIILAFLVTHYTQSKKEWYRRVTSRFFLRIPVVNKLIQKIYLARFCQSMKLLAGAKVMINDALDLVGQMIDYYPIEKALQSVKKDVVEEGKMLNESLAKHKIFPTKLIALIKLSEEVNAPELIFDKLYQQYSSEIEHQQAVVGKLIEPVFIVVLGLFVGFILVAMYLPMFEMSSGTF